MFLGAMQLNTQPFQVRLLPVPIGDIEGNDDTEIADIGEYIGALTRIGEIEPLPIVDICGNDDIGIVDTGEFE